MIESAFLVIAAYLIGSFSSAVVVCYALKLPDPRTLGSGNPGATNVLRHGGKKAAFITFLLDVLKGVIAVLLAKYLILNQIINVSAVPTLAAVTFAVFLGHLYPIFFNFRGGKGVATFYGAITALVWQVGLASVATWLFMAFTLRYSSLSALTSAFLAPIYMVIFNQPTEYVVLTMLLSLLIFWRHRSNIRNLWAGKEDKIGAKRT